MRQPCAKAIAAAGFGPLNKAATRTTASTRKRSITAGTTDQGSVLCSRTARIAFNGEPIPAGRVIRHGCDVRNCINPEHLTPGSHQQNIDDVYGFERLPALTESQIKDIRYCVEHLGMTQAETAAALGLPEIDIRNCVLGIPKDEEITHNDIRRFESRCLVEHDGCWIWLDRHGNPATNPGRMQMRLERIGVRRKAVIRYMETCRKNSASPGNVLTKRA